jgi:hypothetical protein
MWIKAYDGSLINLTFAERLYIRDSDGQSTVLALMRAGYDMALYVGPNRKDCEHFLDRLGIRLASMSSVV